MTKQSPQQTSNSLSDAVLKSQQAIAQTAQDVETASRDELLQAQTGGNEDSIKNAQEQLSQAQSQSAQTQAAYAQTSEQTQA